MSEDKVKAPNLCVICATTELTIDNIVNPTCGHAQCNHCFWRWAKTSNQCPFCRQDIIARDRQSELEIKKLIENRRDLVAHVNDLGSQYLDAKQELDAVRRESELETIHLQHCRREIARKNKDSFLYHEILDLYWRDPTAAKKRLSNLSKETYNIYRDDWQKKLSRCFDEYGIRVRREYVFERDHFIEPVNNPDLFWRKICVKIGGKVVRAERIRRRQQINHNNRRYNRRLSPATAISPEASRSIIHAPSPLFPLTEPPQIRRIPFPFSTGVTPPYSLVPLSQAMSRIGPRFMHTPIRTVAPITPDLFYNYRTSLFYHNVAISPRTAAMRQE